jgi:hypothetical protein
VYPDRYFLSPVFRVDMDLLIVVKLSAKRLGTGLEDQESFPGRSGIHLSRTHREACPVDIGSRSA